MRRTLARLALLLSVALTGWLALSSRSSRGIEPPSGRRAAASVGSTAVNQPKTGGPRRSTFHFVGAGSCAAANCHGGDGSQGTVGSEYSIWIQQDPHARAYTVLFSELSQRMARQLGFKAPAHQSAECLNCHAPHSTSAQLADGVSCESCHGPAEKWLGPHVRRGWNDRTFSEKAKLGFRNTKDILNRARVCAECHVGAPGRDVNHDLIAAGHPRLFFELSAFHANMPKHWPVKDDRARQSPDGKQATRSYLEAKLWAIGQVVSAEAAVRLLKQRANPDNAAWPELSEYACFACHHDLAAPSWRQNRGYANRRPGSFPWGTWYFPFLADVAGELTGEELNASQRAFAMLRQEMSKPYPMRRDIQKHAESLSLDLAEWANTLNDRQYTSENLSALLKRFAGDGRKLATQNWDAATQLYLALVAVHQGFKDLRSSQTTRPQNELAIDASLEKIRKQLEFRKGFNSPREFSSDAVKQIDAELSRIQQVLKSE